MEDATQYGVVSSGPPLNPAEVESLALALEVIVLWGDKSVLQVSHFSPPRSFFIGEAARKDAPVDFVVGIETIGTATLGLQRIPLVLVENTATEVSGIAAVIPPDSAITVVGVDGLPLTFSDLQSQGRMQRYAEINGAFRYPLQQGTTVKLELHGFTFMIKLAPAGKVIPAGGPQDKKPFVFALGSLLLHMLFLLMFYFLPPHPSSLAFDALNTDARLIKYVMDPDEQEKLKAAARGDAEGGSGEKAADEEGQMGKESAQKSRNRAAVKGPADNKDKTLAREQAKEQAKTAGILGVLQAGAWGADMDAPTSPYGKAAALGSDPMSALGAMLGDQIGENFGFGGLGMRGAGRGGGGDGEGTLGLGSLGTIGRGSGSGSGDYGQGKGTLSGRKGGVPGIRSGNAEVRGSLSKDVIRRVIRRHINEVRFCYEQELNQRPDLEGRVTVSFIISPTGAVQSSAVAETSLNNQRVELCIATAVRRWAFPSPEGGGIVVVNYPFVLSAAGGGE